MTVAGSLRTKRNLGRKALLAALLVAGVPAASPGLHADPAAPAPAVPRPEAPDAAARQQANRERIREARLAQLHAGLQLAPDQEKLWPPVADAVHGLAEAGGRDFRRQLDAVADLNAGLELQGDHLAKLGAAMSRLAEAAKPLVASLTPEQKGKLPALLQRAPLRKIVARAFGTRLDADRSAAAPAPAAAPAKPAPASGATPPMDPDDDD